MMVIVALERGEGNANASTIRKKGRDEDGMRETHTLVVSGRPDM